MQESAEIRAVVVSGAGNEAFCAGQDFAEASHFEGDDAGAWMDDWEDLYDSVRSLSKPVVAAINGVAAGSGFQFALLCDIRVGHPLVRMGQPEIHAGLPSITGAWLMWDSLGRSRTIELILRGRMMDAAELSHLGLLHEVVDGDQVKSRAIAIAKELSETPPLAVALNKQRFKELTEQSFREACAAGRLAHEQAYGSGEPRTAMARFFEQRKGKKSQ